MLKPIVIKGTELSKVENALQNQKTGSSDSRLLNKDHKIWKQKVDKTVLVYIPRGENGEFIFESAPQLSLAGLGQYGRDIRLTDGIAGLEDFGISGTTGAKAAIEECYDLHKLLVKQAMVADGRNPEEEMSSDDYRSMLQAHKIPDRAVQYGRSKAVVFPIVEIEIDEQSKQPVQTADGKLITEVYWMTMPEKRFEEKFNKELLDLKNNDFPGNYLRFSYLLPNDLKNSTDESKRNMAAGKAFQVGVRGGSSLFPNNEEAVATYLDTLAKNAGYTKEAIRTSLDAFALYTDEDVNKAIDTAMVDTRAKLAALRSPEAQVQGVVAPAAHTSVAQTAPAVESIDLAL